MTKQKRNIIDDGKFFDLRSDVYFKSFFSKRKMLAMFLTIFWDRKINENDIAYNNTESSRPKGKKINYDIEATVKVDNKKRKIRLNLEMQNQNYTYMGSRIDYYSSRNYSEALGPAETYNIAQSESIWILGFDEIGDYTNNLNGWYTKAYTTTEDGKILNEKRRIILIFLKNKEKCPIIGLEEFFKLFNDLTKDNLPIFTNEFAKEAKEMLISLNNNEALRHEAFSHEMYLKDRNSQLHEAKAEGIAEGEAIGLAKGKAEGEAIGLAKGKAEVVKNMLKLNMSKEIISESTGLSIKEIEEIIKE